MRRKSKSKCPFFRTESVTATVCYGDNPGWCTEQDAPCARDYLCPSAKLISRMDMQLRAMREGLEAAKTGLTAAKDFIGAGLDGMTGGCEDYLEVKRSLTAVSKVLKLTANHRK